MAIFIRKRTRSVQLNKRWGSRRNRILSAVLFSLVAIGSWFFVDATEVKPKEYLVATTNIASSTPLAQSNAIATPMDLGEAESQYINATQQNLGSWVLVRPVNAGELIPISSIGPAAKAECAQIVVALGVTLAKTINIGDSVDLWAADQASIIESIPVQVVTAGELVSAKTATDTFSQTAQSIEICISPAEIRSVVAALARKATIVGIRSQN